MLERVAELHKAGRTDDAERGHRQVLTIDSQCPSHLNGYAPPLAAEGSSRAGAKTARGSSESGKM
jgi:Tfp pilus assembly protein PilW